MKIFLDTNVVMDFLALRGDVESVSRIFKDIEERIHSAYISIGSFYTITYLTEMYLKNKGHVKPERTERLRETLESLLGYINVSGHTKDQLFIAVRNPEFQDLEDAYQYQAALSSGCDCLITSNIKDFIGIEDPLIDILSPKSFCEYQ